MEEIKLHWSVGECRLFAAVAFCIVVFIRIFNLANLVNFTGGQISDRIDMCCGVVLGWCGVV